MMTDLTKEECEAILTSGIYAHMGCSDGDEPYVVPITYVYHHGCIYSYTHEGQKIEIMRNNPKVCVQVERVESGSNWQSVMCWGLFEEVTDSKTIQDVKLLLADQYGASILKGEATPVSPMATHLNQLQDEAAIVYRMKPYRMTGKAEQS